MGWLTLDLYGVLTGWFFKGIFQGQSLTVTGKV